VSDSPKEQLLEALDTMQEALQDAREALSAIWQEEQARDEQLAQYQRAQAQRFALVEEWLTSLDRRVAGAGQGSTAGLGWLPLLSAVHLADAQALLHSLEQTTGYTETQLEQELIATFRVPAINTIPDELWQDVIAWGLWRARQPG
jgi:hypothetical protein